MSKKYRKILLKISGEIFAQEPVLNSIISQLIRLTHRSIRLAVVTGGGNIIRGRDNRKLDPVNADRMGMLATIINGIHLTDLLSPQIPVKHLSAFPVGSFVEPYSVNKARISLQEGSLLILTGGTGNPFFSTDSAAALRAAELNMEVILKGTQVRGVFSADPKKNPDATFYPRLTYEQALNQNLQVMDRTALTLCEQHRIPIVVFDITRPGAILNIINGRKIGSVIC
uniref:Uridylate kinase n=1 Tax=candidate division WOR-3 bacterium TaxID=2052148 RepID=A0A7V3PUT8_UNCW3